jgi:hypothetical protein
MGYDPFTPNASERIVATLNRSGRLFSGTLELFDSSGKSQWKKSYAFRGQKDEDCAALDMAMAIDIRVAFIQFLLPPSAAAPSAPSLPEAPPTPPPAEAPAPASAPVPLKVEPRPLTPSSPPSQPLEHHRSLQGRVGLGGALALKTTPRTFSGELILSAGALWHGWSLDGELRWNPWMSGEPESAWAVSDAKPIASRLALLSVLCRRTKWLKPWFFGCGLLGAAAQMLGRNGATTGTTSETRWSAAFGLRVGLDVPLGSERLMLRTALDALATPPSYGIIYNQNILWRTSAVTGAMGIGIVTTF